jgi:hypothetical protein
MDNQLVEKWVVEKVVLMVDWKDGLRVDTTVDCWDE